MRGAESLLAAAKAAGIEICFANPGTTEIPLVEAFDAASGGDGIRTVLGLSEGVVTGAADAYARLTGVPSMTLLHLGPGFANGIANLHNARRARTPLVNVVGEHASWHQAADAPLASDIESLAAPVSGWVGRTGSAESAADDFVQARQAALQHRLPATLIAAADHMWAEGGRPARIPAPPPMSTVDEQRVAAAAKAVSGGERPALVLGGNALAPDAIREATRIAGALGGEVFAERSPARIDRGPDVPAIASLPYFPEDTLRALEGFSDLVLIGTGTPVAFFGYEGQPSVPVPEGARVHALADAGEDAASAVRDLGEAAGCAGAEIPPQRPAELPDEPTGSLTPSAVAAAIVLCQPEAAVVVNEGVSSSAAYPKFAPAAPRHTELTLTGGAIGMGIPAATGAALARPDSQVIDFQADGSALYTLQGLWTQAREGLDVTTVICANSRYRILEAELSRAGVEQPGAAASGMTNLGGPSPDWTALAGGFGVAASRARSGAELLGELRRALREPGPHLIEAVLE